jgi:uncharacterized membrane protein required for colicin V production
MEESSSRFGPGFLSTFLYYFATTALLTAFITNKGLNFDLATGLPQQLGVIVGLLTGLIGAYFNRTTSFSVTFKNRPVFLQNLNEILSEMGYEEGDRLDGLDDIRIYRRMALGKLLSGRVFVELKPGEATIASRSIQLKGIRERIKSI